MKTMATVYICNGDGTVVPVSLTVERNSAVVSLPDGEQIRICRVYRQIGGSPENAIEYCRA